jgi:hypothetical protein
MSIENVAEVVLRANAAPLMAGFKEAAGAVATSTAQIGASLAGLGSVAKAAVAPVRNGLAEIAAAAEETGKASNSARAPMIGLTDALKDWRTHVRTEARYTNFMAAQVAGLGIASKGAAAEITGLVSAFAFGGGIGVAVELVKMVAHGFHDLAEAEEKAKEEMKKFTDDMVAGTDKVKAWSAATLLALGGASRAEMKAHEEIKPLLKEREDLENAIAVQLGNVAAARETDATNEFEAMQKAGGEEDKKLARMREELRLLDEQIAKRQVAIGAVATAEIKTDTAKEAEEEQKRAAAEEKARQEHLMRVSRAEFEAAKAISKMKDDQLKYQLDRVLEEEKREDVAAAEAQKRVDERFVELKKQVHDLTGEGTRMGAAFGTSFAGIITGTMSVSQAFSNMAKAALHAILDSVRRAIEAYALQAAAAAAAANAGIPGVGLFIAAAAAAAMEALVMGLLGSLPSAAVGMPMVPRDMPVYVHKGERILTVDEAEHGVPGRRGGGMGGGITIVVNAVYADAASLRRLPEDPHFARGMREAVRNGRF